MSNQTFPPNEEVRAILAQNEGARLTSAMIIGLTTELTVLVLNNGIRERDAGRQEGIDAARAAMAHQSDPAVAAPVQDLEVRDVA